MSLTWRGFRALAALGLIGAVAAATAPAAGRPLTSFLAQSGDASGYHFEAPSAETSIQAFIGGDTAQEQQTLRPKLAQDGFVEAVREAGTGSRALLLSVAIEFTSSSGARSASQLLFSAPAKGVKTSTFAVAGVPGARGITTIGRGYSEPGAYWTQGRCALSLVDDALANAGAARALVVRAAQHIYARTSGRCP